jgi:hypothetical protein
MKPGLKYLKSAAIVDGVAVALTNGRFRIAAELSQERTKASDLKLRGRSGASA